MLTDIVLEPSQKYKDLYHQFEQLDDENLADMIQKINIQHPRDIYH